jgi:hypothetical protein
MSAATASRGVSSVTVKALPVALLLVAAGTTAAAVTVLAVSRIAPSPIVQSFLSALVCLTFAGTGIAAVRLRPYLRFGLLLAAVGVTSLISVLHDANGAAAYTAGVIASNVVFAVLVHALLAFPSGRLASPGRRLLAAAAYLDVLLLQAVAVLFDPLTRYHSAHPANLALVDAHSALATGLEEAEAGIAAAVTLAAVAVLVRHARAATTAARRQQVPVLAGGAVALLLFTLGLALAPVSSHAGLLGFGLALVAALALPAAFLGTLVQGRLSRAAVGGLLLELRDPAYPGDLEEALRRALGDPSLRLGRLAADGGHLDGSGEALALPRRDDVQVATPILHQGERIGTLVHDRTLQLRPETLDAVNAAAGFALANERAEVEQRRLAAEHAALRRVATLVAGNAPPSACSRR